MSTGEIVIALIGLISTIFGGIYCPWRQNKIFERQNEIFAAQAGITLPVLSSPAFSVGRYWPTLAMAGSIIAIWTVVGYDMYDRHHQDKILPGVAIPTESAYIPEPDTSIPLISGQTFVNQEVYLDGKRFVDCIFENVTLVYNGKRPVTMYGNKFFGSVTVASNNLSIKAAIELLIGTGFMQSTHIVGGRPFPVQQPNIKRVP